MGGLEWGHAAAGGGGQGVEKGNWSGGEEAEEYGAEAGKHFFNIPKRKTFESYLKQIL